MFHKLRQYFHIYGFIVNFALVNRIQDTFSYETDWFSIADSRWKGCCVHLLCRRGHGYFFFNGMPFGISRNDTLILSNSELITELTADDELEVEYIVISMKLINSFMPPMHYGVGGEVSLFSNPVIHLTEDEADALHADISHLRARLSNPVGPFHENVLNSLAQAMIFDLFNFHAARVDVSKVTESPGDIVRRFMNLVNSGLPGREREVAYYAERLNVTPRYLSDTIRRFSGQSASSLIVQTVIPILTDMLKNSNLTIGQISETLNFTSVSYFSRYCQKHIGMSPAAYRSTLLPKR